MRKFLTNGAGSNIYEDHDPVHGDIIIKRSRYEPGSQKDLDYIEKQTIGYDVVGELLKSGQELGVNLPRLVSIDMENREITEKRINGIDFKAEVYAALTERQKDALANQMALFLHSMHQLRAPQKPQKSIKQIFDLQQNCPNSAKEFIDVYENKLSKQTERTIIDAEKYLMTAPISDEAHVMTHKDLRDQNIMFDEKAQKLSVIDFEMAGAANIYRDFVPQAPASIISWDFTQRIIRFYNAIPNKKYPMNIDIEKVRQALVYGTTHEYARCLKWEKERNPNIDLDTRAGLVECRLSVLLADNKSGFLEAARKLETKIVAQEHLRNKKNISMS